MTTTTFHGWDAAHRTGFLERVRGTLLTWRERMADRAELARWDERELHDIGMSRADLVNELRKPFWRG